MEECRLPRAKKAEQGGKYANRSDLQKPLPITTAPGQGYGKAAEQAMAQRAIPMRPPGPPGAALNAPQANAAPQAPLSAPMMPQEPAPGMAPGELKFLHPTDRPNEPVTTGLSIGPGAGPEALPPAAVKNNSPLLEVLDSLSKQNFAPASIRNMVKNLRAQQQ